MKCKTEQRVMKYFCKFMDIHRLRRGWDNWSSETYVGHPAYIKG